MIKLPPTPVKKWMILVVICGLIVFFRVTILDFASGVYPSLNRAYRPTRPPSDPRPFWQNFSRDLIEADPQIGRLEQPERPDLGIGYNASKHQDRPDLIAPTAYEQERLKESHDFMVSRIKSKSYYLPYEPNTRGIVTTAGGPYLPVAVVSIRMLRESGSNLPVELFLSNEKEFNPVICNEVLPALNAKCLIIQDMLDNYDPKTAATTNLVIEKYQFKIFSILFSSFEEVLFLDSDCFPIHNPDPLFDSEPFNSTGLVLWPDFFYPSESRHFFEIANIQTPELNLRAGTESGEILYSKRIHEDSLLLAAYYNYYGPKQYYPLQSQGGPGEGDKQTFLWSAVALNASFYQVRARVNAVGYITKGGDWRGSGMIQFDPMQDYHRMVAVEESFHSHGAPTVHSPDTPMDTLPTAFFAHVNFPKLDPGQIFEDSSFGASGPTRDSDGSVRRIWHATEEQAVEFFGFDLERRIWAVVKDVACKHERDFESWADKTDICKKARDYWDTIFGGEDTEATSSEETSPSS